MEFVNRFQEIADLSQALTGHQPALVRLYGRRRLGKTEILQKLCKEHDGLYLLLDETDPPRQRASLSYQVAHEQHTIQLPYPQWDAFLDHLTQLGVRFVVLDEFQRLLTSDPQAISRLQHHWDSRMHRSGPSLVLCGSSIGMMQRVTQKRSAPLFGRLSADLRLRPFPYAAVRLLYPDLPEEDVIRRFAIFGGTPYYHQFSVGRELHRAVLEAFLASTAPLIEEPQNLLRLELKAPLRHNSILFEIGNGTHDLPGLESKVGVPHGGLGPYLETLRHELDLVRLENPILGARKRARYVFTDSFFAFYYRFVFDNRPRLELGRADQVWTEIHRDLDGFVGLQFEQVARQALALVNGGAVKDIAVEFDEIGRWWNRQGLEIDIAASGPKQVLLGEVKWSSKPVGLGLLQALEEKSQRVEGIDGRPVRHLLVSRSGFEEGLAAAARERGVLLLDLADIAAICEERYARRRPNTPAH